MLTGPSTVEQDPNENTAIQDGTKVALDVVEVKDHVAFINLREALEAAHRVNHGCVRCWHIYHERTRRDCQGRSGLLRSSAATA
jgi:hypothetical protein